MEWVAGENPRELLSLAKGISGNIAELPEKQKLDAKARLLDLVFSTSSLFIKKIVVICPI